MSQPTNQALPDVADTFDSQALHRRYAQERERRLRRDGSQQYVQPVGDLARYLDDPWAGAPVPRAAVQREVQAVVVGGGFAGLLAAARLRQAGIDDMLMIDKAGDFGGTWYWNRYPGAACDTESYIYLPLLEETGYMPSAKYAKAPEIWAHAQRIGRHFELYERALFQTVITAMDWDDATSRWQVRTDRGDQLAARFVVLAGGLLHRPKLPGIPGIDSFRGHSFHTSRWDYAYTGGSAAGGLSGLADKRVGLIGTGATAVQCVPHLGASAKEFFLFQRTPSSVDVRNDHATDPAWAQSLQPGWQRERVDNFTTVISGGRFDVDLVNDGWTDLITNILLAARRSGRAELSAEETEALIQRADDLKMERVRARVDAIVHDRGTADALKPWYAQFCKRPCFHDDYLPTFNRPNVHLVDTAGQGVERITEHGVVANGREYPLDCLIYGTGFEVGTDYTRRIGFEVSGRGGLTLTDKWRDGAQTMHGLFSHGFPNLFIVSTHQSGQSANFQHMLDVQSRHIGRILGTLVPRGLTSFEASAEAEADWTAQVVKVARGRQAYLDSCTPGYYNNEGQYDDRSLRNAQYWRGPMSFIRQIDRWYAEGSFPGLTLAFDAPPKV